MVCRTLFGKCGNFCAQGYKKSALHFVKIYFSPFMNKLLLARKYARIVVRGYYLFREANSCPRAKLEGNCELRGTDNVRGQLSVHISEAKSSLSSLLSFEYLLSSPAGGYPRITSAHERTLSGHVSRFHQSRARGNI